MGKGKKVISVIAIITTHCFYVNSQFNIGTNNTNLDAILQLVSSDSSQGLITPIVTMANRPTCNATNEALFVYNITDSVIQYCNGTTWLNIKPSLMEDLDADTKIQLEENADDDIIRFDTRGSERMVIDSSGNIGIGTSNPNGALEVVSTTSGFIPPRMSTVQKNAISNPISGMMVWDSTINCFSVYNGASWSCTGTEEDSAAFVLGAGGACSNAEVSGLYLQGDVLGLSHYVEIELNVTTAGIYNIQSDVVSGYSFSSVGTFTSTGLQSVPLFGHGSPAALGLSTFTVSTPYSSGGSCTFSIYIPDLAFHATAADTLSLHLDSDNNQSYIVSWGDGTITTYSDATTNQHVYASPFTGDVTVYVTDTAAVDVFEVSGAFDFDISKLAPFSGLLTFEAGDSNQVTGDIADLPTTLTTLTLMGGNTTFGDLANLPPSLISYANYGANTTSGNVNDLPATLTSFYNEGNNTTSGNIAFLPFGLVYYLNNGNNTVSGDIGNLHASMYFFSTDGNNSTSGDISNLPANINTYSNRGNSTVTHFFTGNANLPPNLTQESTIDAMTTAEVDLLLNDLNAIDWGLTTGTINLAGINQARSAASDAAVTSLTTAGFTINTN